MSRNRFFYLTALTLAFLLAAFSAAGCRLTPKEEPSADASAEPEVSVEPPATIEPILSPWPGNENADASAVVMRCNGVEFNLYDFGQAFYNGRYMQYYMYGMMTPDQYCDTVIDELSGLMYMLCAAKDEGIEVTDEEKAEIDSNLNDYIDQVVENYKDLVEDDAEDLEAAALALLEEDLALDGLDLDSFKVLSARNLYQHKIVEKFNNNLSETVSVSDDDVRAYLEEHLSAAAEESMSDFVADMNAFYEGSAPYPVYIADDCFSVNHIYLGFDSDSDENGSTVYDTQSRIDDEAELEALISEAADYDAFMELETEYGEDPGMDDETYREYGYIIHGDLVNDYFAGFVYAAMNLHEGEWHAPKTGEDGQLPADEPELAFFTLKDGTKIVKVCTESGVHYIIVNKEFKKGPVEYAVGDEHWESWRGAALDTRLADLYENLLNEWKEKYEIEIDTYTIKAKYPPAEDTGDGDK